MLIVCSTVYSKRKMAWNFFNCLISFTKNSIFKGQEPIFRKDPWQGKDFSEIFFPFLKVRDGLCLKMSRIFRNITRKMIKNYKIYGKEAGRYSQVSNFIYMEKKKLLLGWSDSWNWRWVDMTRSHSARLPMNLLCSCGWLWNPDPHLDNPTCAYIHTPLQC